MKTFEEVKTDYLMDNHFIYVEESLTTVGYNNLPEEEKQQYVKRAPDYYVKISNVPDTPDITDTQLLFIAQTETNKLLRTIKNCVVFFTVLTVISLLCGLFAILA